MPKSLRDRALTTLKVVWALFLSKNLLKRRNCSMKSNKDNRFATNKGGIIKAPKSTKTDSPKATVVKGSDLRNGK